MKIHQHFSDEFDHARDDTDQEPDEVPEMGAEPLIERVADAVADEDRRRENEGEIGILGDDSREALFFDQGATCY